MPHGADLLRCLERVRSAQNTEESTSCTLSIKIEPDSRGTSPGMTSHKQFISRLGRIESLLKSLPAIGVIVLQRRRRSGMRGDALRVSRFEHEGHGSRQFHRLQLAIAG